MKLIVLVCNMEGCEECGNETHLIGVFSDDVLANEAEKQHKKTNTHWHPCYIHKYYISLNQYNKMIMEKT